MITEKDIPPEATIVLKGIYCLAANACETLIGKGPIEKTYLTVDVTVNAREALRTGYAWINEGALVQLGEPGCLLFKLETIFGSQKHFFNIETIFGSQKHFFNKKPAVGRKWEFDLPEFDHVLTEKEATDFIVGEMNRFNDVWTAAKTMSQRDLIGEGEICRWCLAELPQPMGKPSDCPRCAKNHNQTEGVMRGSEECLKCEAGITYGPAKLATCFMCSHALKANHFSDGKMIRCPHCKNRFEADSTLPGSFEEECPECKMAFLCRAVLVYDSPTIFEKIEFQVK